MRARAAVFTGAGSGFDLREYQVPDPEPGAALVRIRMANICGSDLHHWRGEGGSPLPKGGRVLGHEMVGTIERLGAGLTVDSVGIPLREGDRVVFPYFYPCRRCWACASGRFHLCPTRTSHYGEPADQPPHFNGAFADYYYLRPNHFIFHVPEELPDSWVASVNCALAQALQAVNLAGIQVGDAVVVQGAGGVGLYTVAAARECGAGRVIAIDGMPERLKLARAFGADETICLQDFPEAQDRVARVLELTDGRGAEVVAELVGSAQAFLEGLKMVQPGGTFLEVGTISSGISANLAPASLVRSNLRLLGLNHYEPHLLPRALDFLVNRRQTYPFDRILSHQFPLQAINQAFREAEWSGKQGGAAVTRAAIVPGEAA